MNFQTKFDTTPGINRREVIEKTISMIRNSPGYIALIRRKKLRHKEKAFTGKHQKSLDEIYSYRTEWDKRKAHEKRKCSTP